MAKTESEPIDQNNNQNDEKRRRDFKLRPKVFTVQDSLLSQVFTSKDMKATYHVILAFVVYALVANGFYLYTHPEQFEREIRFMFESIRHVEFFLVQEIVYHSILFFIIYPTTKRWVSARAGSEQQKIGRLDLVFGIKILAILIVYYLSQLSVILLVDISPVMSIALITEKIRITMKIQAFILEARRRQEAAQEKDKKEFTFIGRKQLLFYMFAPTLVYRDEYPRLQKTDYKLVVKLAVQWLLVLYFMMIITLRIFLPTFSKIGRGPISAREFVLDFTMVFAASSVFCLLVFYGFLHLYQNIWSQIFKFGDRMYYEDWWCCTDYSTYYRKWNILVHDWIHQYLYSPLVHLLNGNRMLAGVLSIYISALAHEYIIIVALRQINPILSILFAGFGVLFFIANGLRKIAFKKKVKKLKENGEATPQLAKKEVDLASTSYTVNNTLFLLSIFNGWFVMITVYGIGYYSNQHCGDKSDLFPSYSWKCLNITA